MIRQSRAVSDMYVQVLSSVYIRRWIPHPPPGPTLKGLLTFDISPAGGVSVPKKVGVGTISFYIELSKNASFGILWHPLRGGVAVESNELLKIVPATGVEYVYAVDVPGIKLRYTPPG